MEWLLATVASPQPPHSGAHRRPWRSSLPSAAHPFVFYHIARTGGTSLRESISKAASRYALTQIIPCHNGVSCACSSHNMAACAARSFSEAAVVAGHFRADQLREEHVSANQTCFYMLRDPISRLASQYAMGMLAGRGRRFLPTPFAQLPPRDMLYLRGFSGDLAQLISGKLHGQAEARRHLDGCLVGVYDLRDAAMSVLRCACCTEGRVRAR